MIKNWLQLLVTNKKILILQSFHYFYKCYNNTLNEIIWFLAPKLFALALHKLNYLLLLFKVKCKEKIYYGALSRIVSTFKYFFCKLCFVLNFLIQRKSNCARYVRRIYSSSVQL